MAVSFHVSRVRTTVHSSQIERAFLPSGMVWDNMRTFMATATALGRADAPKRTGNMARTIGSNLTPSGRFQCQGTLYVDADYAKYVLGGTAGASGNMKVRLAPHSYYTVPNSKYGYPGVLRRKVAGQRKNNFLGRAISRAMRVHGVR